MATQTTLLGLTKPDYSDVQDVGVINGNMEIIDNEMGKRSRADELLDNNYFPDAINQLNANTTTAWTQCLDRWIARSTGIGISIEEDGLHITSSATSNVFIYQKIKTPSAKMLGKTYTVAVCDGSGNIACKSVTLPSTEPTSWTTYATVSAGNVFASIIHSGAGDHGFCVSVGRGGNGTEGVALWAKLYPGSYNVNNLPVHAQKDTTAEYLECVRHYWKSPPSGAIQGYGIVSSTTTNALIAVVLPVPMRVTPSINVISPGQIRAGGTAQSVSELSVSRMDNNVVMLTAKCNGNLPANQTAVLVNASFELNAKL